MFKVTAEDQVGDWTIYHNTSIDMEPLIHIHLDKKIMLIAGTTFLGEIKKGVFGIVSFELPKFDILPMHCGAFTYRGTTNLMFGLSGTGKTTLSSDPDYKLISDDEVAWTNMGIRMIETGCYAKSEGLTPETHPTIFNAVEEARRRDTLVEENPDALNARLSYPISCVENAYHKRSNFDHANNIFFLTMDAEGIFPPISRISGETVRRFFETGYTSQMPGTEAGSNEIKRTFSPCYGSPFMPRNVRTYSDLLMNNIEKHNSNVFLINTGIDGNTGKRFDLEFTRNTIKQAIQTEYPLRDTSEEVLEKLENILYEK
jgi:phosphoenolpyruvate carboxykinase (ATP)